MMNVAYMETEETLCTHLKLLNILKTYNPELDRKLGGGLRLPTLTLIEGPNDSGKSVLAYQFCYGALQCGYNVCFITTEQTLRGLINTMESLSYDVRKYFLSGKLRIYELHVNDFKWNPKITKNLLNVLINFMKYSLSKFKIFIIDSLTHLLTYAETTSVLNFFTNMLNLVDSGISIIISLHDYALNQDLMIRVRSICDTHIVLNVRELSGKVVRFMKILKAKGIEKTSDFIICFEVSPTFGLRILPYTQAKA